MSHPLRFLVPLLMLIGFGCLGSGCATAPAAAAPAPVDPAKEEAAVRATVDRMNDLLAQRDLEGLVALFDDSDGIMLVGSDVGERWNGRAAVRKFFGWVVKQKFTFKFDGKVDAHVDRDSAWCFREGNMIHVRPDGTSNSVPYRFAITMVKRGDQWRWQLFHGSIPRGE